MTGAAREKEKDKLEEEKCTMGGVAVWRCGGDDGGMAVVCFLVFLLHSRMLSRVYLPAPS